MRYINYFSGVLIAGILSGLFTGCTLASKHHAEIAAADIPYIARIRTGRAESTVVIYNSEICKQISDACGFFRSHAYAHELLNHQILPPDQYPDSLEEAADCWAAKNAEPFEVAAAVRLLSDKEQYGSLPVTGDPEIRAGHIRNCARETGNWP